MTQRKWIIAYGVLLIFTLLRVATTHRIFSATVDEPVEVVGGQEWWLGEVAFNPEHPPLPKVLFGLPFRNHARIDVTPRSARGMFLLNEGNDIRNVARARISNLLFLALAIVVVIAWSRRFGDGVAFLAASFLASMPTILGHAGIASADVAAAATLSLALFCFDRWLRRPSVGRASVLGIAIALGALSKFSFLVFFPVCAVPLAVIAWRGRRSDIPKLLIAILVAIPIVWAMYRFTFAPVLAMQSHHLPDPARLPRALAWFLTRVPVPAPAFFDGPLILHAYDVLGTPAFLFGRVFTHGVWYYFPAVFFFKTPLPFLLLAALGALRRDAREFALIPLVIMLCVLPSSLDIGVREILPIYPPLCILAALGAARLWHGRQPLRALAVACCAWMFIGAAFAHPHYLAWFNEAAGRHPERIASDSNLDWGQDMLILAKTTRARHIDSIALWCVSAMPFSRHGVPDRPLEPFQTVGGWVAVSETLLVTDPKAEGYRWLDAYPYERIGRSIRLYHIPQR